MYVPMAGFWWAVLEGLFLLASRAQVRLLPLVAVALLALLFLGQTIERNRDWQSNEAIFRATLADNPATDRVHFNLATTYDYLEGNLPGARRHYEAVLAIYEARKQSPVSGVTVPVGEEIKVRLSLGSVLLRQQEYSDAYPVFNSVMPLVQQEAFRLQAAEAALGLGQCFLGLGEYGSASQALQQAATLDATLAPRVRDLMRGAPLPDARVR